MNNFWYQNNVNTAVTVYLSAAFSISSESSQVVLIAVSSAVAIILLTVLLYILIGRFVLNHSQLECCDFNSYWFIKYYLFIK